MGHPSTTGGGTHMLVKYSLIVMDSLAEGYKNERGDKSKGLEHF